jgi:hypothetical protein
LTITTGENERIKSFAVYFLRNVPQDRAIKTDVFSDQDTIGMSSDDLGGCWGVQVH